MPQRRGKDTAVSPIEHAGKHHRSGTYAETEAAEQRGNAHASVSLDEPESRDVPSSPDQCQNERAFHWPEPLLEWPEGESSPPRFLAVAAEQDHQQQHDRKRKGGQPGVEPKVAQRRNATIQDPRRDQGEHEKR